MFNTYSKVIETAIVTMLDRFFLAYRNISERKTRSLMTLLGIAVGIAAIIALMAVGYGMEHAISGELTKMADVIHVVPIWFHKTMHSCCTKNDSLQFFLVNHFRCPGTTASRSRVL